MSTASRNPRADAARRGWLIAITAWAGFVGAALTVALIVALLPHEVAATLGWHEFSIAFLCAWLLSMLTVGFALSLALPLGAGRRHGR